MQRGLFFGAAISIVVFSVLGCIGGAVAYSSVAKQANDARKGWNLVPVVVAAVDIPENTAVTMEMISQRSIPEQFVTSSVVKPDSASYIVNQKTLVAMQAGDPLLWSAFETTKAAEKLTDRTPEDARLISIKASGEAGVGGWVRPEDHVDVIAVYIAPDTKELTSMTLLEDVRVVATGRITGTTNINLLGESDRRYSEVSVVLAPEDAERVALMANLGTLTLTLRNPKSPRARAKAPKQTVKTVTAR